MHDIFSELTLVIAITAGVSVLMRMLRQPIILGYILAGLLVGPSLLNLIHSVEVFETFSSIGIALLLFIIGLGMDVAELRRLGKVVPAVALTSLLSITLLGFATSTLMGFTVAEALITGLALFFSSTIIIVKILSDKKQQNRLHGQIAIGVILVEDIIATLALLFIVAGQNGGIQASEILLLLGKGLGLMATLVVFSTLILPRVSKYFASNQELLFLAAITWGFGIATLFEKAGFSIEIGALFSGVALASSPYAHEVSSRLKPLRDFFIVLFFITLGRSMNLDNLTSALGPAAILSAIVIFAKPFVVTSALGVMGYAKRVSFKAGINLSQVSEFSIILVVLASSNGLVSDKLNAIITLVAIITIATSTYMMKYDDKLFTIFDRLKLHLFEKEVTYREHRNRGGHQLVLFGYHHGGHEFIKAFQDINKKYLVVDYDPLVIDSLDSQKIPFLYGDATDVELLHELNIDKVKLVICTFSDYKTTQQLVTYISEVNPEAVIICHANNKSEAVELYELGSTYVMIPQYIGTEKISSFIRRKGLDKKEFESFREKHLSQLHSYLEPAAQ